jgi:hypothetical protein
MDAVSHLPAAAFLHTIEEANIEEAFARFVALADQDISFDAFRDAIAQCQRNGFISEPIRLPEGALQCHWRLQLTPAGVAAARQLRAMSLNESSGQIV